VAETASVTLDLSSWDLFIKSLQGSLKTTVPYLKASYNTRGFKDIIDHFEKEEGTQGKWEPRADSTQAMYAAISSGRRKPPAGGRAGSYDPGNKLLQLTGKTRQSILPGVVSIRPKSVHAIVIEAKTAYSGFLDEGTSKMPARPFMWISGGAHDDISAMVLDLLLREQR